jgi:hypothetical protein
MNHVYIGNQPLKVNNLQPEGKFVTIDGMDFYEIKHFDKMPVFFISIASNSDHWMYLSSNGGITAGRKNSNLSLFPYYTDDKIIDFASLTGSTTLIRIHTKKRWQLWEPFSEKYEGLYNIERSIAKNTAGTSIIFKETNTDLGLVFQYRWMNSGQFGWVRKSSIHSTQDQNIKCEVLDGLQNILPAGVDTATQNAYSTLVDAYKKTELINDVSLALFRMESILVDRAEPSEALRVNTVWTSGFEDPTILLSSQQIDLFRQGEIPVTENEVKGIRGAMLCYSSLELEPGNTKSWYFAAEVNQDASRVNNLRYQLKHQSNLITLLEADCINGTEQLKTIVSKADGIQHTADQHGMARHYSNVLFNTMRGGIYADEYTINSRHWIEHTEYFNKALADHYKPFFQKLPAQLNYLQFKKLVHEQNDPQLYRLFLEYLPLTFSRRHGDPSRPWNQFNIQVQDNEGKPLLSYQGNWRDIFQNWEALTLSYPYYCPSIIAKFLNATTADGYNPYRLTHEGIEWETIEPDNPWSNIGYWGDHQIIYLSKLLELAEKHSSEELISWLSQKQFAFANVPYRLKSYDEIVKNPHDSIHFDAALHHAIEDQTTTRGADAKLLHNKEGEIMLVTMTEKLMATFLAKLSNYIPDAGIWMNTLRPEWNDANNALVGYGASMVTVYYLRRFTAFLSGLISQSPQPVFTITQEMADFFEAIEATLKNYEPILQKGFSDKQRRQFVDQLGQAGNNYRNQVYNGHNGETYQLKREALLQLFTIALTYIDKAITNNQRNDKLYHAYNLVKFTDTSITIRRLYEMLEGQVAVLSSGALTLDETISILAALRKSSLYRSDQQSYLLYPDKQLPSYIEKNNIPSLALNNIPLLQKMVEKGDTSVITADKMGEIHFNADFKNAGYLKLALSKLRTSGKWEINQDTEQALLDLYEEVFDHQSFTGRSGSFYKYEGLGSIYWHMVSKLLLAVGENIQQAQFTEHKALGKLQQFYYEIKAGIGAHKSPVNYGSFPFDPYSHTPRMSGVQQPGMTGQVKEDILNRFNELGVIVSGGSIQFEPLLIQAEEWIQPGVGSKWVAPYLQFTYCGTPITYQQSKETKTEVIYTDGSSTLFTSNKMDIKVSSQVFARKGNIQQIIYYHSTIK